MNTNHPHQNLHPLIHAPLRLTIMSALAGVDSADFAALREIVQITQPNLSKQLATLEAAGYIEIIKGKAGRRPRTWAALTPTGRTALNQHIQALHEITALAKTTIESSDAARQ